MERVIGIFRSLIKQPLNPFANLAEQAKKIAEINAIISIWPHLESSEHDPHGSIDIGAGYLLLGPTDKTPMIFPKKKKSHLAISILVLQVDPSRRNLYIDGEDSGSRQNKSRDPIGKRLFALREGHEPIETLRYPIYLKLFLRLNFVLN
jgi:hypothetical protein